MTIAYYIAAALIGWITAEIPAMFGFRAVPLSFNFALAFVAICILHAKLN